MTFRRQRREDPAYLTAMREAKELFDAEMAKNSMKGRGRPKTVVAAAPAAAAEVEIDHEVADEIDDLHVGGGGRRGGGGARRSVGDGRAAQGAKPAAKPAVKPATSAGKSAAKLRQGAARRPRRREEAGRKEEGRPREEGGREEALARWPARASAFLLDRDGALTTSRAASAPCATAPPTSVV